MNTVVKGTLNLIGAAALSFGSNNINVIDFSKDPFNVPNRNGIPIVEWQEVKNYSLLKETVVVACEKYAAWREDFFIRNGFPDVVRTDIEYAREIAISKMSDEEWKRYLALTLTDEYKRMHGVMELVMPDGHIYYYYPVMGCFI